jgi:hypothetical protein
MTLVVFLRPAAVEASGRFWHTGSPIGVELYAGDYVLAFRRMVRVGGQFGLQSLRANAGGVLIASAMRNEGFVGDIQGELAVLSFSADMKGVFPGEGHSLEADILDDEATHFAPGTNTRVARVGAGATDFTRFARRRFGGTPSAGSTTIRLVTNFLIP